MRFAPLFGIFLLAGSLSAATYDNIVAFGDSLSDTGNASIITGGVFPGPGYAPGRFSNGPLWVEDLASRLGVPNPQPALAGGSNYAVASAVTGTGSPIDIGSQVGLYLGLPGNSTDSSALYTIWGGANDLFNGGTGKSAADSLSSNIQSLAAAGAKSFLWVNLPPLDRTPRGATNAQFLQTETAAFNLEWSQDLASLKGLGINVTGVDVFSLFGAVLQDPGAYGIQNVTTPAQNLTGIDPNTYLFWDIQHPTAAGHAAVANLAFNDLTTTATPEPASYALFAAGFSGLVLISMRRRSSSR